ncbi:MAG TPA: DoxX family protein [Terriglobales bacterium]|nr:DoxX family protein [Terriglobales bacterium]
MGSAVVQAASVSKARLWTGRVLTVLVAIFGIFDGVTKVLLTPQVRAASAPLGFDDRHIVAIGVFLLVFLALYLIPRTAVFGALLLTAYLGGAFAIMFHAGMPPFEMLFPVIFAVLAWAGLYAREPRLAALVPLRAPGER